MTAFYRQFSWPEAPSSEAAHVAFQCTNGVVLALYAASNYDRQHGPIASGFRGFTLGLNCHGMKEVEQLYEVIRTYEDVHDLDPPQRMPWGGGFGFRDPEGNVWEIAWAEGSRFDDQGGLIFP